MALSSVPVTASSPGPSRPSSLAIALAVSTWSPVIMTGRMPALPPRTTAFGAMLSHLTDDTNVENYQPMNINFGIFPTISGEKTASGKFRKIKGSERKTAYCERALADLSPWLEKLNENKA